MTDVCRSNLLLI